MTRTKVIASTSGQITEELTAAENAEIDIREAEWAAGQTNRNALSEITRLESKETLRRMAEASADTAAGNSEGRKWLKDNRALIAIERAKLT